tara:strand:- start:863 stop:1690 length:828 start_codon:yes stop_codon:yes gene_type:complete
MEVPFSIQHLTLLISSLTLPQILFSSADDERLYFDMPSTGFLTQDTSDDTVLFFPGKVAEEMMTLLTAGENNLISEYGHDHAFTQQKDQSYALRTNCYGFAAIVLTVTFPGAYREIESVMHDTACQTPVSFDGIPCPFHYVNAIKTTRLHYWERILSIMDCQAGDLLVYLSPGYTLSETPQKKTERTGTHIMFVESLKERAKDNFYHVRVVDCTRRPHSRKYDSRWKGKGSKGGVGQSSVFIKPINKERVELRWSMKSRLIHDKDLYILRPLSRE